MYHLHAYLHVYLYGQWNCQQIESSDTTQYFWRQERALSSIYLPLIVCINMVVIFMECKCMITASLILRLLPSFRHIYKPQAWLHSGITVLHAGKEALLPEVIIHKWLYGLGLDTFSWMVLLPLAQNVCHTKDKIIEAKEEESQQQAELLRQSQTECENLRIMMKVSIGFLRYHNDSSYLNHPIIRTPPFSRKND